LAVAFCGATDNGPYLDEMVDRAWDAVQSAASLEEAGKLIASSIKTSHKEFGQIYQPGFQPQAELIYGVRINGESELFHAYGPAITKQSKYVSGGIGSYMVDFLVARMYRNVLSLRECIILAAYVLLQTKEHVEGCGGDSHVAILPNEGVFGLIDNGRTDAVTNLLEAGDIEIGKTLLSYADVNLSNERVEEAIHRALSVSLIARRAEVENLKSNEEFWANFTGIGLNEFGLLDPAIKRKAQE